MKKLLITALLVVSTLLASCAGGDSETTTTKKPTGQPEEAKLASTYATLREDRAASLTVDGSNAELVLICGETTSKYSGAISYTATELTIGENKFPFSLFENYIVIEDANQVTYMLEPVEKTDYNYLGVYMLSNNWTSDNVSISFEGFKCTYTKDGVTISNTCVASEGFIKLESPNTNIAIGATATDSANEGGMTPDLAIDGDTGSRWGSLREDNHYIIVDLGEVKNVSAVRIYWETASGCNFNIETSTDGETWTIAEEVTDNTVQNDYTVHEFASTPAQFVKMNGFTRTTVYGFSIWEFEIYEAYTDGFDASYEVIDGNLQLTIAGEKYTLTAAK